MKNIPDKPHELEVSRVDLISHLKFLSKAMGKSARSVTIRFQAGMLVIEAGESTVEVFARGDWPTAIMGDALWVRVLAKKMPAGEADNVRCGQRHFEAIGVPFAVAVTADEV